MPFPIDDDFSIKCPDCGGDKFLVSLNKWRSIVSCQNCPYVEIHDNKKIELDSEAIAAEIAQTPRLEELWS